MHFETPSGLFLYVHLLNTRSDAVWRIFRGLILTASRGLRLSSVLSCGPMLCRLSRGGSDMNEVYRPPADDVEGVVRNQTALSHRTTAGALRAADELLRTKIESGGRRGEEPAFTSNRLLRFCDSGVTSLLWTSSSSNPSLIKSSGLRSQRRWM